MADADLIACLYPVEDNYGHARKAIKKLNKLRYVPAQLPQSEVQYGRRDRAPTQVSLWCGANPLDCLPRIELRFSQPPKTSHGFVFGWDVNSDIVLPWIQGISFHHFALTFDEQNRLIVKDLGSFSGTEVTYDRKGQGKRSNFVWIIGGHKTPKGMTSIVINVHDTLKFQIVVSDHEIQSAQYVDNINRFRQGAASMDNLVSQIHLRSRPQTELASGAETPGTDPIVLKRELGRGAFGVVSYIWDVSTGEEHALKEPSVEAIRAGKVKYDAWKNEARIMGQISHDHIVAFLRSTFTPWPQLCFEYIPGGALENHDDISLNDGVQILCQCLSALTYLHGLEPPIVHRDIKPANILVQYRYAGLINVKFGDFGLSRDTPDPTTLCGTCKYIAPEIWNEADRREAHHTRRSYTPAVDIWSLGVTVCECVYGLPESRLGRADWCEEIVERLARDYHYADRLQRFLCDEMLIIAPSLRGTAESCYTRALLLDDVSEDHSWTPPPASIQHNLESQCRAIDGYGGDQQTILLQDVAIWPGDPQEQDSVDSADTQRHQRSDAPPQTFGKAASQITNFDSWVTWTGGSQKRKSSCKSSSGRKSRKRQHNHERSTLPVVEPELDGPSQLQSDVPASLDDGYDGEGHDGQGHDGQGFDASWEEEQTEELALADSEPGMEAALLNAMHGDSELRHHVRTALP